MSELSSSMPFTPIREGGTVVPLTIIDGFSASGNDVVKDDCSPSYVYVSVCFVVTSVAPVTY